jgi:PAS domain S-box-containing protein
MTTEQTLRLIRNSPDTLVAIFNHHFQLTGLLGTDGRVLIVNETALKLIGATEHEVLDKYFWETPWWTHSSELQDQLRAAIKKAAAGEFVRFEVGHPDTEGNIRQFDFSLNPLRGATGEVEYLVPEARDITEIKSTERALQAALAELKTLKDQLQKENLFLKEEIRQERDIAGMIGQGPAFRNVLAQVEQVAPTDATVLIVGETGTGKELIVSAIHDLSARKERPLVKVNCAALPSSLIESELFGHEKGAFTGALTRKPGRFELANGGTLFLDEIGDLSIDLQAKLLRVLQESEFERIGGAETIKVDVRVIAATNSDLEELLATGDFREDLYYRLNVFPILMPPLRDRREDIPLLVRYFIDRYGAELGKSELTISRKDMDALSAYHWPGNIRELQNIIERAIILCSGDKIEFGDWFAKDPNAEPSAVTASLQELEREHICRTLEKTSWRVSGKGGAAEILGLKPTTLEARMKKHGIHRAR